MMGFYIQLIGQNLIGDCPIPTHTEILAMMGSLVCPIESDKLIIKQDHVCNSCCE